MMGVGTARRIPRPPALRRTARKAVRDWCRAFDNRSRAGTTRRRTSSVLVLRSDWRTEDEAGDQGCARRFPTG